VIKAPVLFIHIGAVGAKCSKCETCEQRAMLAAE